MSRLAWLLGGAGTAAVAGVAIVIGSRKAAATLEAVQRGVNAPPGSRVPAKLRLTHYYPWAAVTEAEKRMEGGVHDRKEKPLHSVEDFLAGRSDHVSLSGDDAIWPYGQKLLVPWGDVVLVGRVTDTGGHFRGAGKMVRAAGYEPIDVCVYDKNNRPPKTLVEAVIVAGDHLEKKPREVALEKLGKPVVGGGLELLGCEWGNAA